MKDEDCGKSFDPLSLECEPEPQLDRPDESTHFTPPNNFYTTLATTTHNKKYLEP
jgi:hypothetical protein